MNKKVLIIAGSPRAGGNCDTLCEQFAVGANEAGNHTSTVYLRDKNINYCTGCGACFKSKKCSQKDDMDGVLERMIDSDVIFMATPVYF